MLLAFSSLVQNADSFTNNSNKTCAYDVTESHNSPLRDNTTEVLWQQFSNMFTETLIERRQSRNKSELQYKRVKKSK